MSDDEIQALRVRCAELERELEYNGGPRLDRVRQLEEALRDALAHLDPKSKDAIRLRAVLQRAT